MAESSTKTAVVTAILTGIFTVAAGVVTYLITTKEPALSYSVVGGPSLTSQSGEKRIYVVELRNSGRKEVSQAFLMLSIKDGELGEVASEASPGVKIDEERAANKVELHADLLNPGDVVKVSLLVEGSTSSAEPTVVARAPGVQAVRESISREGIFKKEKPPELFALIASALGAILSSFIMISQRSSFLRKLGLPSVGSTLDQAEIGAFICDSCGLREEGDRLRFSGSDTSYRGIADYLRYRALECAQEKRSPYLVALRALLLTSGFSPSSVTVIRKTIDDIGESPMSDAEFKSLRKRSVDEGNDPIAWREAILSYVLAQKSAGG